MIPYMVGKLAPCSSHLSRELVKYVPGRGSFHAVSSQNGDKSVTSPPPPSIVERVLWLYPPSARVKLSTFSDVIYHIYVKGLLFSFFKVSRLLGGSLIRNVGLAD